MPETIYLKDIKETYKPKTIQQEIKEELLSALADYSEPLKNLKELEETRKFNAVLDSLFPRIIGQYEQKKKVLLSLVSGSHVHFKGNIGTAKTEWTKQILDITPKKMLVLPLCPINEGPERFYNLEKACPVCRSAYSKMEEKDVEVKYVERNETKGIGFSWIQGGPSISSEQISGTVNFEALARMSAGEKVGLEELLQLGPLLKANRGILRIDELGKIKTEHQAEFLNPLNQRGGLVTFPEKNLYFPVNVLVLATSKDIGWTDRIIPDLKDRFTEITTSYPNTWQEELDIAKSRSIDEIFMPTVFEVAGIGSVRNLRKKLLATDIEEGISVRKSIDIITKSKAVAMVKYNLGFQEKIVTLDNVKEALQSLELQKHFNNNERTVETAFKEASDKTRSCFKSRIKEAVFDNSDFHYTKFLEELSRVNEKNINSTPRVAKFMKWAVGEEDKMDEKETVNMLKQYLGFLRE